MRLDKAQRCYSGGTEVIEHGPQVGYARDDASCYSSVSVGIFRFSASPGGWNHDRGKAAFRGQLLEGRQIVTLQVVPAAEQLSALPLQLLKLKLLSLRWS